MANPSVLKRLFLLPLLAVPIQGCSSGRSAASVDANKFTLELGEFTDNRDGKKYKTTKIGEQVWMAENLNYEESGSMCYNNKAKNCDKYGRLYGWEAAMRACPAGWHLPSNEEWDVLIGYVGNTNKLKEINSWSPTNKWYSYIVENTGMLSAFFVISLFCKDSECFLVVNGFGLALISVISVSSFFINPIINAKLSGINDNYGFSALPGGYAESSAREFAEIKKNGGWWTATEADSSEAYYRSLYHDIYNTIKRNHYKSFLLSVRCIMDL